MLNVEPSPVNSRIQSVDRAVDLLEAVAAAGEPETAPALADRCRLNRSTAWRLLATLEHHGLVERDPASNRYSLGFALVRLAAAAGHEPLVRLAHPLYGEAVRAWLTARGFATSEVGELRKRVAAGATPTGR